MLLLKCNAMFEMESMIFITVFHYYMSSLMPRRNRLQTSHKYNQRYLLIRHTQLHSCNVLLSVYAGLLDFLISFLCTGLITGGNTPDNNPETGTTAAPEAIELDLIEGTSTLSLPEDLLDVEVASLVMAFWGPIELVSTTNGTFFEASELRKLWSSCWLDDSSGAASWPNITPRSALLVILLLLVAVLLKVL